MSTIVPCSPYFGSILSSYCLVDQLGEILWGIEALLCSYGNFFVKQVHDTGRVGNGTVHMSTRRTHARPAPGTVRRSLRGPRSGTAITGFSTVTGIDSKFSAFRRS